MAKKWLMPALLAVILIQLLVPVYMIAGKFDTLRNGEEFLFKVSPVDPYDAFRGRYVSLNARQEVSGYGKYGLIAVGEDGFAYVSEITEDKPASGVYVKSNGDYWFSLPIDRYYMDEKSAPRAEVITRQRESEREAYVAVRIKNGNLVVSGLFVDGLPIEEILRNE